jgi:hypothetical protein
MFEIKPRGGKSLTLDRFVDHINLLSVYGSVAQVPDYSPSGVSRAVSGRVSHTPRKATSIS